MCMCSPEAIWEVKRGTLLSGGGKNMHSRCTVTVSRFTLQLIAAKNTHYIKKKLPIKIVQNSIPYKKTQWVRAYLSQEWR